MIFAFCDKCVR